MLLIMCVVAALLSLVGSDVLRLENTASIILHAILAVTIIISCVWCIVTGITLSKRKQNKPAAINIVVGVFALYGAIKFVFMLLNS